MTADYTIKMCDYYTSGYWGGESLFLAKAVKIV